jgi:hypothetical protein
VAVVAIVVAHILLVRRHGVVPPLQLREMAAKATASEPAAGGREPSS